MRFYINIKNLITVFIIYLLSILISQSALAIDNNDECKILYQVLKSNIESINKCTRSSECGYIHLKNRKNNGCGFIGNIESNLDIVNQADKEHYSKCIKGTNLENVIEECPVDRKLTCINNKCTPCVIIGKTGKCICPKNNGTSCK